MEISQCSSILFLMSLFCLNHIVLSTPHGPEWVNHGGNIYNRRYAELESKISPSIASNLRLNWSFNAGKDITATPSVFDDTVYFPCWNGNIYAVKAADGTLVWQKNLHELTGLNASLPLANVTAMVSRATPTVADDKLIVTIYGPAYVVAMRRSTGDLIWMRQLETHWAAVVTMSGTYYGRAYYVGVSSLEEGSSIENCCTFRGSFVKLDVQTGNILWRTYMLPDNNGTTGGYAGAAIWGSSPSIDEGRNHVYIATGNLYSVPASVEKCQSIQNNQTVPTKQDQCIEPNVHSESILALDLSTGDIKWSKQIGGYDVWFFACNNPSTPKCPPGPNPDADFGEAPMIFSTVVNGTQLDLAVAVQKSGFAWAVDRDNGNIVWSTEAGPGSIIGGGTWGAATDQERVYTNIANGAKLNFTLLPSNNVTRGGGWVAMNASTGQILWSTALPDGATTNPVTVANGVLFAGSTYRTGPVYAINAETGAILWSYHTGASVYGGFSVSKGCAYIGTGYGVTLGALNPSFSAGTSLFAFCVEL